jgi:hypothetical protein
MQTFIIFHVIIIATHIFPPHSYTQTRERENERVRKNNCFAWSKEKDSKSNFAIKTEQF